MKEEEVGGLVVCFSSAAAVRRPGSFANGPLFSLSFPFNSSLLLSSSHLRGGHALNDVARALQDRRHGGEASLLWFRTSRNNGGGSIRRRRERERAREPMRKTSKARKTLSLSVSLSQSPIALLTGNVQESPRNSVEGSGSFICFPFRVLKKVCFFFLGETEKANF